MESTALRRVNASAGESVRGKRLMNLRGRREVGLRVEIRGLRAARLRLERRKYRFQVHCWDVFRVEEKINPIYIMSSVSPCRIPGKIIHKRSHHLLQYILLGWIGL